MTVAIIVQARMGSSRLPGKVMKSVQGMPLLGILLDRLQCVKHPAKVVVATTKSTLDDCLEDFCKKRGVLCFRGSEDNVLERYLGAASLVEGDVIVRITADCPLIDPQLIDRVLDLYFDDPCDLASNTMRRTFPRGMDVEVVSLGALKIAALESKTDWEKEHVTSYLYNHPDHFVLRGLEGQQDFSRYRWTVDTEEDLKLIEKLFAAIFHLHPLFTLEDLLHIMKENPAWETINAHIQQKHETNESSSF